MRAGPIGPADFYRALETAYKLKRTKKRVGPMEVWETEAGKAILVPSQLPPGCTAFPYEVLEEILEQLVQLGELPADPGPPN